MTAVGLDRAHVLGHSFGGALALEFARRHPALVASLILAGGYAGWAGSLPAAEVERRRLAYQAQFDAVEDVAGHGAPYADDESGSEADPDADADAPAATSDAPVGSATP